MMIAAAGVLGRRVAIAALLVVAVAVPDDKGSAATGPDNPLKAVGFIPGTTRVQVSFVLSPSMVPFAIHFDLKAATRSIEGRHQTDFVLPGIRKGDEANDPSNAPMNFGVTTKTTWTSGPWLGTNLEGDGGGVVWSVHLDYAPRVSCTGVGRCVGIRHAPAVEFRTGPTPGGAVGFSDASGGHASTTVHGYLWPGASLVTVRVGSLPNGQDVHISWNITCASGPTVSEKDKAARKTSGSWDDITPVHDENHVNVPRWDSSLPGRRDCFLTARGTLSRGSGHVFLSVYARQTS
jgi:hypothetical protein